MRKARSKVKKNLAGNKPGSEAFARLLEEAIEHQELAAEYEAMMQGMNYSNFSNSKKREFLCSIFN